MIEAQPADPALGKSGGAMYIVDLGDRSFVIAVSRFTKPRTDPDQELKAAESMMLKSLGGEGEIVSKGPPRWSPGP